MKLVEENERLEDIIREQEKVIEELKKQLEGLQRPPVFARTVPYFEAPFDVEHVPSTTRVRR